VASQDDRLVIAKAISMPLGAVLLVACSLIGCQSPKSSIAPGNGIDRSTRNNGYSLLHQVLDEQKDASILRFIKPEHSDVKKLVNRIATTSGTGSRLLEEFASHDSSIVLDDLRLPPGEVGARDAIASTKKHELLSETGDEFEMTLLLTQTEALSYAWHLAKVTAENESQPDRARALSGLGDDMRRLYRDVFALMLSKTKSSATNLAAIHN
jgi:hypothetical protein